MANYPPALIKTTPTVYKAGTQGREQSRREPTLPFVDWPKGHDQRLMTIKGPKHTLLRHHPPQGKRVTHPIPAPTDPHNQTGRERTQ